MPVMSASRKKRNRPDYFAIGIFINHGDLPLIALMIDKIIGESVFKTVSLVNDCRILHSYGRRGLKIQPGIGLTRCSENIQKDFTKLKSTGHARHCTRPLS